MTSPGDAAAKAAALGHRPSHRSYRGTTRSTCVCCSITSLTRIAYGSRVRRHGRSRPSRSNQASRAFSWPSVSAAGTALSSPPRRSGEHAFEGFTVRRLAVGEEDELDRQIEQRPEPSADVVTRDVRAAAELDVQPVAEVRERVAGHDRA